MYEKAIWVSFIRSFSARKPYDNAHGRTESMTTACEHGGDWCERRTGGDPRKTLNIRNRSHPFRRDFNFWALPRAAGGNRRAGWGKAQLRGLAPSRQRRGYSDPPPRSAQKAAIPVAREDKLSGSLALPPAHLIFSSIHIELPALSGRLGHGVQDASRAKRKRSAEHEPNGQNRRRHLVQLCQRPIPQGHILLALQDHEENADCIFAGDRNYSFWALGGGGPG